MISGEKLHTFYKYSLIFIVVNAVFIWYDSFYLALIPFVFSILFLSMFSLDKLLLIVVFFVPLSIPLREYAPQLPIDFYIPTEPILLGILVLFIYKYLIEGRFDRAVLTHPITLIIGFNLLWIGISALTSSMIVVSLKFLLVRTWFLIAFYLLATQLFRNPERIKHYVLAYAIPMVIVIGYAIFRHQAISIFDKNAAHYVMNPFFTDHTSYGAALAMFLPVLLGFAFKGRFTPNQKFLLWTLIVIFSIATILSYTRAAWLSLVAVLGIYLLIRFRIKPAYLFAAGFLIAVVVFSNWSSIMIELSRNKQDSSQDIGEHIQSMSNIRTDASNMERLNRWNSAFRMFEEKPLFGWGPGTYMFQYASFQISHEKTIISTNAGDMGNAHSEYFGPLAESGLLGMLSFFAIVFIIMFYGYRLFYQLEDKELKMIALSLSLGFTTYVLHGFLNNFLDTDKISAPFWGFAAAIVALDIYQKKNVKSQT